MATKRNRTQQDSQVLDTIFHTLQSDRHKQIDPYVNDPSLVDQVHNMKRLRDIARLVFSYLHMTVDIVPIIIREIKKLATRTIETTSLFAKETAPPKYEHHRKTETITSRKRKTPSTLTVPVRVSQSMRPYIKDPSLINHIVSLEELRAMVHDAIAHVRKIHSIIQIGKQYARQVKNTTHKFSRTK